MLNFYATPLSSGWVKNVHNMCVAYGMNCGLVSTSTHSLRNKPTTQRVKPLFFTQLTTSFTPTLYTVIFRYFNLLHNLLYTVSTAPTNSKKK
jgi:hypothetical protein